MNLPEEDPKIAEERHKLFDQWRELGPPFDKMASIVQNQIPYDKATVADWFADFAKVRREYDEQHMATRSKAVELAASTVEFMTRIGTS